MGRVQGHERQLRNGRSTRVREHSRRGSIASDVYEWLAPKLGSAAQGTISGVRRGLSWMATKSAAFTVNQISRARQASRRWQANWEEAKEEQRQAEAVRTARKPTRNPVETPKTEFTAAHKQAGEDLDRERRQARAERKEEEIYRAAKRQSRPTEQASKEEVQALLDGLQTKRRAERDRQKVAAREIHRQADPTA